MVNRGTHHPVRRGFKHSGETIIAVENGSFGGKRCSPLIHCINKDAVKVFCSLQFKDFISLGPRNNQGIHLAIPDSAERVFSFFEARSEIIYFAEIILFSLAFFFIQGL